MNLVRDAGELAEVLDHADVQLCAAEAGVALADARLRLFDAALISVKRLARVAGISILEAAPLPTESRRNLSRQQFAALMGVSVRRVDYHRTEMTAGLHFHRDGRRVLFHVPEAEDFVRQAVARGMPSDDIEVVAIDEVTRRRARVALRRARGGPA